MNRILIFLLTLLLITSCRKDSGERLFEIIYPPFQFEIPAGLSTFGVKVFEFNDVPSNIDFYLTDNNLTEEQITSISPSYANLISIDGQDYDFVRNISVRICDPDATDCIMAEEVFYIEEIQNRTGDRVGLLPTLRNAKRHVALQNFRLEIVFQFHTITPYSVLSRLEIGFDALK